MKRHVIVGLSILAVLYGLGVAPVFAGGKVYYAAPQKAGGSDSADGLAPAPSGGSGPFLTVARGISALGPGDTLYLRGGVYYEAGIVLDKGGRKGAPITIAAYKKEKPVIDGSKAGGEASGIEITGSGYLVFDGLEIRKMPASGLVTYDRVTRPYKDLTIKNCDFHHNGYTGLDLAAVDGFLIENVQAHDNDYYGLNLLSSKDGRLSCANGKVVRSKFHNHEGDEGHGMAVNQGHSIRVTGCLAYHNRIHGFDVTDWPKKGELSHDIVLENNYSYDNGVSGFSINSDSNHVVYRRNIAWQNGASWAGRGSGSGFWCYEGCWHVLWEHNVSYKNSDAGFRVDDRAGEYGRPRDRTLTWRNNIGFENGNASWEETYALVVSDGGWSLTADHNNWAGMPGREYAVVGLDMRGDDGRKLTPGDVNNGALPGGNVSVDPGFVKPGKQDFRLKKNSPMIDAGARTKEKHCGRAPDMGALEYCP